MSEPSMPLHYMFSPEVDKIKLLIDGEEVELDKDTVDKWEFTKNDDGSYQLGNTKFEIL